MKCTRNKTNNKVERVTDEIADQRVAKGTHQYETKKAWREETRDINKPKKK